ncbi:MAG: BrnA antitoxin family protein [Candidatus Rokubacteria bacterium]|nr:BrnA antitoxin family protein [Candidatus Rokubacteria bacterium]
MKKEYDFSRAKRRTVRDLPPIEDLDRHTKVRITIMLDNDVLQFFKARAAKRGAEPYQTQVNRALREYMEGGRPPTKDDLLGDEGFVSRLAERVAEYSTRKTVSRRPR